MDLASLDQAVQYFCDKGIAESTHKTYQSALRKFAHFCSTFSIVSPFPVSEALLCYYSSFLACENLTPQTIKTYLAALRHTQVVLGLPEPSQLSSLPRLKLVQAGIQRAHALSQCTSRIRLPITPAILLKLRSYWNSLPTSPDRTVLWAAATICFFGFFRSGEITLPTTSAFDPSMHLSWGDLTIDNRACPSILKVHLKRSKSDQLGKGVDVFIGRTDGPLCPMAAVLTYIEIRGTADGPFFMLSSGQPLIKSHFISEIRHALQALGLPYQNFAGHSFRIGAATTAATAGLEDSVIRSLGRWNSDAFLTYIRTPREHLAKLSNLLART